MPAASLRTRANFAHRSSNLGLGVTHEASTAMGMAFTSWRMSMGKLYVLHLLRIHDHEGLHILQLSGQIEGAREQQG